MLHVIYQIPSILFAEILVERFGAYFWILPKSSGHLEKKRDKCSYSIYLSKYHHKKRRYYRNNVPANRLKILKNPPVFHDVNLANIMTTIW